MKISIETQFRLIEADDSHNLCAISTLKQNIFFKSHKDALNYLNYRQKVA